MLTHKQEKFCISFLETGNATESYRRAYPKSLNWKPSSAECEASKLLNNPMVLQRLEELKAPIIEKAQITFESHLEELKSLRDEARAAGQFSAAIKAEENRGKVAGLYVEKRETSFKDGKLPDVTVRLVSAIDCA